MLPIYSFIDELQKIAEALQVLDDKKDLDKILKPGDILYTKPREIKNIPSKIFYNVEKIFQGSPYTHVGLYIGDGQIVDAGIWKNRGKSSTEVHKIPLKNFAERYKFKVLRVNASKKEREEAVEYAKNQVGKSFNISGMLRLALPFRSKREKEKIRKEQAEFFCSELIANAYNHVGLAKKYDTKHVKPKDIYTSTKTKTIAEFR